jgi:SAM-dependent methyltransferase
MPSLEWNLNWFGLEAAWEDHGEEWSQWFGDSDLLWHGVIRPRIRHSLPAAVGVEIACGHGRCTRFLAAECEQLIAIDLSQEILDVCAGRLSDLDNVTYRVTDGMTLPVEDGSVDFVFSWDSLVHAEADVLDAYVGEIARVLRPGGSAFLHHSNFGQYVDPTAGTSQATPNHLRGTTMTAQRLRERCREVGIACMVQELIPWGGGSAYIDCFSLLRNTGGADVDPIVFEHSAFETELRNLRRLHQLYRPPPG